MQDCYLPFAIEVDSFVPVAAVAARISSHIRTQRLVAPEFRVCAELYLPFYSLLRHDKLTHHLAPVSITCFSMSATAVGVLTGSWNHALAFCNTDFRSPELTPVRQQAMLWYRCGSLMTSAPSKWLC